MKIEIHHYHHSDKSVIDLLNQIFNLFKKIVMTNEELAAKLSAMGDEVTTIATGVQTLLDAVKNADNVPQPVQDAANALQTKLDALKTEAGA